MLFHLVTQLVSPSADAPLASTAGIEEGEEITLHCCDIEGGGGWLTRMATCA